MCLKMIPLIDAKTYLDIISCLKTGIRNLCGLTQQFKVLNMLAIFFFRSLMINIPPFWLSYESMVVSPELNIFTQNNNNNNNKVTVSATIFCICLMYIFFGIGQRKQLSSSQLKDLTLPHVTLSQIT